MTISGKNKTKEIIATESKNVQKRRLFLTVIDNGAGLVFG